MGRISWNKFIKRWEMGRVKESILYWYRLFYYAKCLYTKKEGVNMPSNQELIKDHVREKCRYCDINDCDGIRIAIDGKTRCTRDEKKR